MVSSFRDCLFSPLKELMLTPLGLLNVDFMSTTAIFLVNLTSTDPSLTQKMHSLDLEVENGEILTKSAAYEIFVTKSLLSTEIKDPKMRIFLLDRLISIAVTHRQQLGTDRNFSISSVSKRCSQKKN